MKIKAIIIDDERKAIAILKNKLERFCPNIELIAETQDPNKGIELINELEPQLVFLDVAMPEINGFEVLKKFKQPNFEVIFATAFDNYAIEAINHCAIGYLVKPIDNSDLIKAVHKAILNIEHKTALVKNKLLVENLATTTFKNKKIIIPSMDSIEFITIENIIHCEGDGGYTKIHIKDKKTILSSSSIGHFNKMLENNGFYLVHKSHLINTNYIDKYLNEGYVVLTNKKNIPVSRNRKIPFLQHLKNL
ncbi:MAG: response regulator transcription factor [Flavobacteriaceae bacterium]